MLVCSCQDTCVNKLDKKCAHLSVEAMRKQCLHTSSIFTRHMLSARPMTCTITYSVCRHGVVYNRSDWSVQYLLCRGISMRESTC